MDSAELTYDCDSDLWSAPDGSRYIKNAFREDAPNWVQVRQNEWCIRYMGITYVLDWPDTLDPEFLQAAKRVIHGRMKTRAPSSLRTYSSTIRAIAQLAMANELDVGAESLRDLEAVHTIWSSLTAYDKLTFREMYRQFVELKLCGAERHVADRMRVWKARNDVQPLRAVIRWDPNSGALSTSELEVVRRLLDDVTQDVSVADHFARMSLRIFLATMRRPSQILQIPSTGLKRITSTRGEQFFLQIPLVKGQASAEARWEGIPASIAKDIQAYRDRPSVAHSCQTSEFLLPYVLTNGKQADLSTPYFNSICKRWFRRRNIVSPRTGGQMAFATTRLRHTGATQMAMQGYARQTIQDALQHDSPISANAYIDSVGADTLPLFEKMDERLGSRFSDLKNAWFNGQIVEAELDAGPPIIVPNLSTPAVVGACGKPGPCTLHPLFSCYSCQYFLAFREANHSKALDFVEQEYARWRDAEIGAFRSKAMKDFERTACGVRDVIDRIEREKAYDAS